MTEASKPMQKNLKPETENPKLAIIVAHSQNRIVGRDNDLPWRLSGDLKNFKRLTMHKPIIMGRKTFDSIGWPLPGRMNIVVTRDENWSADGVEIVHSLEGAMSLAGNVAQESCQSEYFVIGGAELYKLALPSADRLYVTLVGAEIEGDAYFPDVDYSQWRQTDKKAFDSDEKNEYPFTFLVFDR